MAAYKSVFALMPALRKVRLSWILQCGKMLITERVITVLTRGIDVMMVYFIVTDRTHGVMKTLVFVTPVYVVVCTIIVCLNEVLVNMGYDVTGIEELKKIAGQHHRPSQWFKRFVSWILRRRTTIFLIGSWFYLDPDYVTLLLRDKTRTVWSDILLITTPSVILSMVVWTPIYWCACGGVRWAAWIMR